VEHPRIEDRIGGRVVEVLAGAADDRVVVAVAVEVADRQGCPEQVVVFPGVPEAGQPLQEVAARAEAEAECRAVGDGDGTGVVAGAEILVRGADDQVRVGVAVEVADRQGGAEAVTRLDELTDVVGTDEQAAFRSELGCSRVRQRQGDDGGDQDEPTTGSCAGSSV
jgi:hypothetical protein